MPIYILLFTLIYLSIRLSYSIFHKEKIYFSFKFVFIELLGFTAILTYIFNSLYFNDALDRNFIISRNLIFSSFIFVILALGLGFGVSIIGSIAEKNLEQNNHFLKNYHLPISIYSNSWIIVSISLLFFIFCILELSIPLNSINNQILSFGLIIISLILGVLLGIYIFRSEYYPDEIVFLVLVALVICLMPLLFENLTFSNLLSLEFSISFISLAYGYIISFLILKLRTRAKFNEIQENKLNENKVENQEVPNKENNSVEDLLSEKSLIDSENMEKRIIERSPKPESMISLRELSKV